MNKERAVLAGSCFWGMQDLIRRYDGVLSTRAGYTGGGARHATYRNHGGHAEAVEITFDPSRVSYRQLLEFFFQIHDSSTRNRQGNDVGSSYRSAIFYTSEEQHRIAEDTIADVMLPVYGRARLSPKSFQQATFGKRSWSTRTTCSEIPAATPATSCDPTGNCRGVRFLSRHRAIPSSNRRSALELIDQEQT